METIQLICAIWTGKLIRLLTRTFNMGGGTAAPGLYALKIDKNLISKLTKKLTRGSIVITGTNGKTTTSRIISHYFSQNNISYIHNRAGSNLERGIASTFIDNVNLWGAFSNVEYGLWEMDEAEFARSVTRLNPKIIVLLNLFRDQLDRYGEVDATRKKWESTLKYISRDCKIIYNNDDPQIVALVQHVSKTNPGIQTYGYSIKGEQNTDTQNGLLDPLNLVLCPQCTAKLTFLEKTITGQGHFNCVSCGFKNSTSKYQISTFTLNPERSEGIIQADNQTTAFTTTLIGLINIYNYLAAFASLSVLGYKSESITQSVQNIKGAFGRFEKIQYQDRTLLLCLIKNPTGAKESLRTIFHANFHTDTACFALNDNFADGKDVSWIWDIPWESAVNNFGKNIITAGTRTYDMATRLHYAGIEESKIHTIENIEQVLRSIIELSSKYETIPIFATYTATIEIQKLLEKNGVKKSYWEE